MSRSTEPKAEWELIAEQNAAIRRSREIDGMRKLLDILEAHPELRMPYHLTTGTVHVPDKESLAQWVRVLPGVKAKEVDEYAFRVRAYLNGVTDDDGQRHGFEVTVSCNRGAVCEKVSKGTEMKEVTVSYGKPVTEMQMVEVTEWVCPPALLSLLETDGK
jgi:hypothetical protein